MKKAPGLAWAAGTVLRAQGVTDRLGDLAGTENARLQRLAVGFVNRTRLGELLLADGDLEVRLAALSRLQARGWLDDALLLRVAGSDVVELREMATLILVREHSPFPLKLAEQVCKDRLARGLLLEELALRPRANTGAWLLRLLELNEHKLAPVERMLALAALPGEWLTTRFGREVLQAAMHKSPTVSFRAQVAAARFPAKLADSLVEDFVAIARRGSVEALLSCYIRVSRSGEAALLKASEQLSSKAASSVNTWLASRKSPAVREKIQRVLDGKGPLPAHLLRLVGPYLKKQSHIDKVLKFLDRGAEPQAIFAFECLLEAEVYSPKMLEHALEDEGGRRAMRLMRALRTRIPEKGLLELLEDGAPVVRVVACGLLADRVPSRGKLSRKVEEELLDLAKEEPMEQLRRAAQRSLVLAGSEAAGLGVWRSMSKAARQEHGIDWLISRPRVWSHELLLKEREAVSQTKPEDDEQAADQKFYDQKLLLALAQLQDRGATQELMRRLPDLSVLMLRRGKHLLVKQLDGKGVERLGKLLRAGDTKLNEEQRLEILAWLPKKKELEPLMRYLWRKDPSHEVRMAALHNLLRGPQAKALIGQVSKMLEKPLDETDEEIVFEVVGSLGLPLSEDALRLLARLVVTAPLAEPRREVGLSLETEWGSSRGDYPMLRPIGNLLRRDDKARPGKALGAEIAAEVTARDRLHLINRRRIGLFLSVLAIRADIYDDAAPPLARLLVDAPDTAEVFLGPAFMALAEKAERDQRYAEAARLYRRACDHLLRRSLPRFVQVAFLGDPDPAEQFQPYAALAAKPDTCQARALLAAGRRAAAENLLRRARDLAYGDSQALAEVRSLLGKEKSNR